MGYQLFEVFSPRRGTCTVTVRSFSSPRTTSETSKAPRPRLRCREPGTPSIRSGWSTA